MPISLSLAEGHASHVVGGEEDMVRKNRGYAFRLIQIKSRHTMWWEQREEARVYHIYVCLCSRQALFHTMQLHISLGVERTKLT